MKRKRMRWRGAGEERGSLKTRENNNLFYQFIIFKSWIDGSMGGSNSMASRFPRFPRLQIISKNFKLIKKFDLKAHLICILSFYKHPKKRSKRTR